MSNNKEEINEFIRDMTSVVPRPKSEVRSRLNEILADQKQQIAEEIEGMKETDLSNFKVCKDSRNCQFGYNQALSDILTNLKK